MERGVTICLDTNYLIRGLALETDEAKLLIKWYKKNVRLITSSIAWYEFLCGPVSKEHIQVMRSFLTGGIVVFGELQAFESARLFNAVNRTRRLRVDAMIAATAILEKAQLATANHDDFQLFVPFGLQLKN